MRMSRIDEGRKQRKRRWHQTIRMRVTTIERTTCRSVDTRIMLRMCDFPFALSFGFWSVRLPLTIPNLNRIDIQNNKKYESNDNFSLTSFGSLRITEFGNKNERNFVLKICTWFDYIFVGWWDWLVLLGLIARITGELNANNAEYYSNRNVATGGAMNSCSVSYHKPYTMSYIDESMSMNVSGLFWFQITP